MSFSVNDIVRNPVGLIVQGQIQLDNGTVYGGFYHPGVYGTAARVTFTGMTRNTAPVDFDNMSRGMTILADIVNGFPVNGQKVNSYNLMLTGTNEELNVFRLSAGDLASAQGMQISVPPGSTVIINVDGRDITFQNQAIFLQGAVREKIFWNFPRAESIFLNSISFQGSLLAPRAEVTLQNGNLEGTLVSSSLKGTGEFHHFPFTGWEMFEIKNRIYFWWDGPVETGTEYTIVIDDDVVIAADGTGLVSPFNLPFFFADGRSPFQRETAAVRWASGGKGCRVIPSC